MPLVAPETFISLIYIAAGGLLIMLGVPLYLGWIPPNRFYGFRTAATLDQADVWYAVNRVTGGWLAITGTSTAGVASVLERFKVGLATTAAVNCAVVVIGLVFMLVHSLRTLWRMK